MSALSKALLSPPAQPPDGRNSTALSVLRGFLDASDKAGDPRLGSAEAVRELIEWGCIPEDSLDPAARRRWWCGLCGGSTVVGDGLSVGPEGAVLSSPDLCTCYCVEEVPTLEFLLAWASLGLERIAIAERCGRFIAHDGFVVWRRMNKAQAAAHRIGYSKVDPVMAFAREQAVRWVTRDAWPRTCPYTGGFGTADGDIYGVHRAWPAMRELARIGVELVGHVPGNTKSAEFTTLAVVVP